LLLELKSTQPIAKPQSSGAGAVQTPADATQAPARHSGVAPVHVFAASPVSAHSPQLSGSLLMSVHVNALATVHACWHGPFVPLHTGFASVHPPAPSMQTIEAHVTPLDSQTTGG